MRQTCEAALVAEQHKQKINGIHKSTRTLMTKFSLMQKVLHELKYTIPQHFS